MNWIMDLDPSDLSELRGILKARIELCSNRKVTSSKGTIDYWNEQQEIARDLLDKANKGHFERE